jgi:simple sugar transport system permease protein
MVEHVQRAGVTLAAVAVGLLVGALILGATGHPVLASYRELWQGAVGSSFSLGLTLNRAAVLILTALGFIVAFRAGLMNIGAEGYIYVGGAAAAAAALALGSLPTVLSVPLCLAAAAIAAAALSSLAGVLRIWRHVPEVLSTLLLNFIAIQIVSYLVRNPDLLQESSRSNASGYAGTASNLPQSALVPQNTRLPAVLSSNPAHWGIVVAVLVATLVWLLFRSTLLGFRFRVVGSRLATAEFSGLAVKKLSIGAMAISGAIGGLAGASLVLGDRFRILDGISPGFGYVGILVALLGRASPLGAVLAGVLFAGLQLGGQSVEASGSAPQAIVLVLQGVIVVALAAALPVERFLARRRMAQ